MKVGEELITFETMNKMCDDRFVGVSLKVMHERVAVQTMTYGANTWAGWRRDTQTLFFLGGIVCEICQK